MSEYASTFLKHCMEEIIPKIQAQINDERSIEHLLEILHEECADLGDVNASIWRNRPEITLLACLDQMPDDIKILILTYSPNAEFDLFCEWANKAYFDNFRMEKSDIIGRRASASELCVTSSYRENRFSQIPVDVLNDTEKIVRTLSMQTVKIFARRLQECLPLHLVKEGVKIPLFEGFKIDGESSIFEMRCAVFPLGLQRMLIISLNVGYRQFSLQDMAYMENAIEMFYGDLSVTYGKEDDLTDDDSDDITVDSDS